VPEYCLHRQDGVRVGPLVGDLAAEFDQDGAGVPRGVGDERLEGPDDAPVDRLGDVLHAPPVPAEQQPLGKPPGVPLGFRASEQRGVPVQERLQLRLQPSQLLEVHRSLRPGESRAKL